MRGEGPLCEQRVPSPRPPHPPKNVICPDVKRLGAQGEARAQASRILYTRGRTVFAVRPVFFMPPGDVTSGRHPVGARGPAGSLTKVLGRERGNTRGRGKPFFKTVSLSPSHKDYFFVGGTPQAAVTRLGLDVCGMLSDSPRQRLFTAA